MLRLMAITMRLMETGLGKLLCPPVLDMIVGDS